MKNWPHNEVVVLINPLHTGGGFKSWLRSAGIGYRSIYTFDPQQLERFQENYLLEDENAAIVQSVDEAIDALKDAHATAVIPATEPSVPFADHLALRLGVAGNPTSTSMARRDKSEMRKLAGERGVPIPRFELVDLSRLEARLDEWSFPCVVKHRAGAGANGVMIIAQSENAAEAVRRLPQTDTFGAPVTHVLIEDYVGGPEFAVNTLSSAGIHHLIDVWEYRARPDGTTSHPYWNLSQLTGDDPRRQQLWSAVQKMLNALDVRYGMAHVEVKMFDQRVYLIELGNRLPGAHITDVWQSFQGMNPWKLTLDAYLGNKQVPLPPPGGGAVGIVCVEAQDMSTTIAVELPGILEEFQKLFPTVVLQPFLGESSARSTENLDSMGAFILLRASSPDEWGRAERTLREQLRKGRP